MRDSEKTKEQLIKELEGLRTRVAQLEKRSVGERKPRESRWGSEKKLSAERRQVEQELKKKTDELQLILDSVPALIYYKDKDGRMLNMNEATASLTKVPKEKLLQRTVFQLMPDSAGRYHKDDMEVITSGKAKRNIEEPLDLPGKKRWLKTDKLPIKDEDGNVTGLIGFSVDITERKNAEEALRRSEEKLRVMFESMTDGVVVTDLNGVITDVNKAILKTFGYSKDEVIGLNGLDVIAFEDKERSIKNLALSVTGSEIIGVQEYNILTKSGQKRNAEISVNTLFDITGKPYGFITVIRDVTERKKAEEALKESERRYSSIFNNPLNMVFVHDENGVFIDANEAALKRLGYDRSYLGNVKIRDVAHPDDVSKTDEVLAKVIEKGFMDERIELRLISRLGEVIWVEVYEFPLESTEGKYRGMGIAVDITERRKTEAALRQSEERYRLIAENMSDVIWITDLNLRYQYVSPSIEHMRGFTADEAVRMMSWEYLSEDSLKMATKRLADELDLEKIGGADPDRVTTMDLEVAKKDGSWMWIEVRVSFLRDNEGKPIGLLGISRDVTERRRVQEALRESEEKLRVIFDSMGDAATIVDMHDNIIDCNEATLWLYGFGSKSELTGRKASELVAVADRGRAVKDALSALKEPYVSGRAEYKLLAKDGREFDGEFGVSVMRDKTGKPMGFVGLAHDISERKRAEEAVRQSEEKLRLMFDSMTDGVVVTDTQFNIVDVNEAAVSFSGYSRKELIGVSGIMFIRASDRERSADIVNAIVDSKHAQEKHEHVYMRTDDTQSNIEVTTSVLRDSSEKVIGFVNVVRDVTERKQMEDALKRSEEKYRDLVEKERDVIFSVDALGFITSINPAVEGWGYTPEEILGKNFIELIPEDWREKTAIELQNALLASGELTAETKVIHKSGKVLPIEYSAMVIRDGEKYVGAQGVVRDVSERKRAEEALRQSEEKFRVMFESIPDGIAVIDLKTGKLVDSNPSALRMFGLDREEAIGQDAFNFIVEKDRVKAFDDMQNTLAKGTSTMSEWCLLSKGGKEFDCEATAAVINDSSGAPLFMVNVIRDVTERRRIEKELDDYRNNLEKMVQERTSDLIKANKDLKHEVAERQRAEDELRSSEEKLRLIFDSIGEGIVVTDLDGIVKELNDDAVRMVGYDRKEELIGRSSLEPVAASDHDRAVRDQMLMLESGVGVPGEYRFVKKDGREFDGELRGAVLRDSHGNPMELLEVFRDITERKKMEDAVKTSEEKLRGIFNSIHDTVVLTDLEFTILDLNDAALEMSGSKSKEELIGTKGYDFIDPEDFGRAMATRPEAVEGRPVPRAEYKIINKLGKEMYVDVGVSMYQDPSGKTAGFVAVLKDVTERRRMEQALRDSEEKLRIIFESIGDGVIVTDMEGTITETNEAAARLGGWSDKTELIGMSGFDFVAESERSKMVADMIRALKERRSINVEYPVKDKEGRAYQSEVNVTLLRDASDSPKGIVSVIRDITERKRMEQDLRDSEEMSRGMLESAATAVCIVKDGKFAYVSPMFAEMTGYTVEELIDRVSTSYVHEDDRENVMREAVANLKGESTAPHEYRLLRKDGSFIWILEKIASIQYKGERAAIGSLLDITRLKHVEEALRDSEEKLRLIFASLPDGVTVTDLNGKIIEENDAGIRLSGFKSKEQVIGLNGFDFIAVSDRSRALADLPKIFETGVSGPLEYRMVSIDGKEYYGEVIASMMRDKSGNPQWFITVIRDVTERKKAREELQESQEMTRGMLESAATGIYLVQDGVFRYVNPLFSGISGYTPEELLGSDSMSYVHPDDREIARIKVIENLKGISDLPHEFRFIRKDGQPIWILEKVASIEYKGRRAAIGSFMDISERKRIEEVLRQRSQELEQRTNQLLALQKITASIQSTLDLRKILQQVANGVVHNLGFDHALIIKVDEAAGVGRGMVFATKEDISKVSELQKTISRRLTDIELPQVKGYSRVVDNAMDGKATVTQDFFEVASAVLTQDESDAAAELMGVRTTVVMPLFARDRHVGSILALTKQADIGNVLLEPLRILSDQAGVAVENADLYRGVSELAQRLSVISALSKILGSSLDIKGVYHAFIEEIKKVMNFDRTSIAMVEGDKLRYFVVAEEVDTELKDGSTLPLSDSATGLVVKTKRTLIEQDFDKEMKFPIDHIYHRSGLRSAIRVPLFSKGEVFATFNLASKEPNAYGEREREILEQVSGSLTAAIENSRLFDQVKQHEAELLKAYEDLKSVQAYMLQAEKLRALGEMAGGVAHDFNNILAVVLGRTQLALEDVKDEKLKKDLEIIEQTAMDAATTVRRLQDFARVRVERNFEALDLKEVVESALQMAESRRVKLKEREGITIDIESKLHDTAIVEGDAAELREGLLNIVFNAMDAMPKGGKITVESEQTKDWVTIAISDTGIGIPEEIRTKIFEPFFTTRVHKGTGLGLSVTYGIIQRHRGEIKVDSTVGVGSTFYIKLPVYEGVVSKKHLVGKADAAKSVSILMVDDNPEVAGILGLTLKRLGHKVTEANSGEAAINTFELGNFDLVITDLGMPDMSGYEVAKIVKEIKPGTPVLVISGWGGQLNLDEMPEVDGVIAKPFSKEVLVEKIAALLSRDDAKARDLRQEAAKTKKVGKGEPKGDKADEGLTGRRKLKKKKDTGPDK